MSPCCLLWDGNALRNNHLTCCSDCNRILNIPAEKCSRRVETMNSIFFLCHSSRCDNFFFKFRLIINFMTNFFFVAKFLIYENFQSLLYLIFYTNKMPCQLTHIVPMIILRMRAAWSQITDDVVDKDETFYVIVKSVCVQWEMEKCNS